MSRDENSITLNDSALELLNNEMERTKLDPLGIMVAIRKRDDIPDGLKLTRIQKWLKREMRYERKELFLYVMNRLKELPSREYLTEKRQKLLDEIKRTGVKFTELVERFPDTPENFDMKAVRRALTANNKYLESDTIEYLELSYAALPDDPLIVPSEEDLMDLAIELQRTGVTPGEFLKLTRNKAPGDLKPAKIYTLFAFSAPKIKQSHMDWILEELRDIPSNPDQD